MLWMRVALLLLIGGAMLNSASGADDEALAKLRADRKTAAERPRRVIFNNDGNEPVYQCRTTSVEELLDYRTTPLAGSHVDTIFYCTWSSGFDLFTHDTKVGHIFATREGRFSTNLADKFLAAGIDPLRVMVDFGHQNKLEVFWSFRPNDTHDGSPTDYGPIMFRANQFKQQHPEWLIGSPTRAPKFGAWSGVDYARPEIRELAFKYIEEVCRNYDVDGIDIDFFRHPVFFGRAAQAGAACNDEERSQMTDLVRRIRAMTEAEGLRRGRPLLVAFRVPDSADYCRDIGLDVDRWLDEGLFDLLVVAGYFQLNPWDTSVAWAKRGHVPVYPSLDESRVSDPAANKLRMTVEAYRGRALVAWRAGMNGVYLFNSFDPKLPMWRELGDAKSLERLDHDYFASVRGVGGAAGGALPHRDYQKIPTLNPKHPLVAAPAKHASLTIPFASESALAANSAAVVTLRLQFKNLKSAGDVQVTLNDLRHDASRFADGWLEFRLPAGLPKLGTNRVDVAVPEGKEPLEWTDLHCTVRWH